MYDSWTKSKKALLRLFEMNKIEGSISSANCNKNTSSDKNQVAIHSCDLWRRSLLKRSIGSCVKITTSFRFLSERWGAECGGRGRDLDPVSDALKPSRSLRCYGFRR